MNNDNKNKASENLSKIIHKAHDIEKRLQKTYKMAQKAS